MNKRHWMQLFFMAILGLVLAACSPSAGQGTATRETEEQVAVVTPTAGAPDTAQASPTATHTPPPAPASPTATTAPEAATATPLPTPTAASTRVLLAFVPVDGGGGDVLNLRNDHPIKDGRNITLPGFAQSEITEPMVFGNQIVFQVEIFDKDVGQADGDGIQQVEFTIRDGDEVVHERTERNAGYCAFGGGEPDCDVWAFYEHGGNWPKGQPVREGVFYVVDIHIVANSGGTADWMWSFKVDLP